MRAVHKSINIVFRLQHKHELMGFVVITRELVDWKRVPLLVSYRCNIHQAKNMSAVQHGVAMK